MGIRPTYLRCEYLVNPEGIDVTAPRLSWTLETTDPEARGQSQTAYHIQVADSLSDLLEGRAERWDSGRIDSDATAQIVYEGSGLTSGSACWWRVRVWDRKGETSDWSEAARWSMGLLNANDWQATWISGDAVAPPVQDKPKSDVVGDFSDLHLPPPSYIRKELMIDRPVRRAVVYATALGVYELHLNGQRVGEDYFTPGWSDYRKRVYYNTYDVTDRLQRGENALGAILADGWYAGHIAFGRIRGRYGAEPMLRLQLAIEYEDGGLETVGTDDSWRTAHGPLLEADLLMGEAYDARKDICGWADSGFDAVGWNPCRKTDAPEIALEAYPGVTVQEICEIPAETVREPQPGVFVYDLGQNMVGWARLKVRGPAGTEIKLRFAEVLDTDGMLYTTNLRDARNWDRYICDGSGDEVWEPHFTFHGFRYVEVCGYPGHPPLDAVTGIVLHSAAPVTGVFECSNSMVNQLVHNILWGQRGNYFEVPTDCPQRDERLGWTGDTQVFLPTGCYNMDTAAFITKWLVDLEDSQNDAGVYAHVAPDVGFGFDSPAWADAAIVCPYILYRFYGDTRVIERHYDAMSKYIQYIETNSEEYLRPAIGFGDWVSLNAETPKDVIATAYFAYVAGLLGEMAEVIGRAEDAKKFRELSHRVTAAFNEAYVNEEGRVKGDTQTSCVLPLAMDLLPETGRAPVVDHLIRDLMVRNWHLSTGFVGLPLLLPTLTRFGRTDIAYRLLLNETFPSWGYEIKNGATTIWERWDGWTEEFGFQDAGMNSFNHYAYGAVGEWLYATVGGVSEGEPGYRTAVIRPQPGGGLTRVNCRYNSIRGWIGSAWRLEENAFYLDVRIPPNMEADVHIPSVAVESVFEGETPVDRAEGVTVLGLGDGETVVRVGSGCYKFFSKGIRL